MFRLEKDVLHMSQYSHGYEAQSRMRETQRVYDPDPIDLQQVEYQQCYQHAQQSPLQQVPPQQNGAQPLAHHMYVQHVFVYPRNGPDSLSRIAGAFSYIGGWFSALLVLLFMPRNRFTRFHALQSLFLFGGMNVIYIAFFQIGSFWLHTLGFWQFGKLFFFILVLAFVFLNVIAGISWFVGIGGAMSGKYVKLPFVGDLAERLTGGPAR
jgi:uncharacterized membrane protein